MTLGLLLTPGLYTEIWPIFEHLTYILTHGQYFHSCLKFRHLTYICHTFWQLAFFWHLAYITSITFLGLKIDDQLTWKYHINHIKSKISYVSFLLNKVKNILPFEAKKTLYYTLIYSQLAYGILAWGHSTSINKIFLLQKRVLRIMQNKSYRHHTDPLFRSANILKLPDIYTQQVILFVQKLKEKKMPLSFNDFLPENTRNIRRTRYFSHFQRTRPRTTFTSLLPRHHFIKIWDKLNKDLQTISKVSELKRKHTKTMHWKICWKYYL